MSQVYMPANDFLPKRFQAVDVRKSSGAGFEIHLWGSGGLYNQGSNGVSGYRAGYGAALVGNLKRQFFTLSIGNNDEADDVITTHTKYGEGRGARRGDLPYMECGGGGTGIRLADGSLFAIAPGGGGSYSGQAIYGYYAYNGGDAGLWPHGGGQGGQGGRTYDGTSVGPAGNGDADGGGNGGTSTPVSAMDVAGSGGGAGGDGSGGGGGGGNGAGVVSKPGGNGGVDGADGEDGAYSGADATRGAGGYGKDHPTMPGYGGQKGTYHGSGGGGYGGGGGGGTSHGASGAGSALVPDGWTLSRADGDADPDRSNAGDHDNNGAAKIIY
ncbi:MAG: hypothetical protein CMM61_12920 [Rhodospirillaceae bacterium]|nr:hypothetical protein [Rhodospirillaceae bacterium]